MLVVRCLVRWVVVDVFAGAVTLLSGRLLSCEVTVDYSCATCGAVGDLVYTVTIGGGCEGSGSSSVVMCAWMAGAEDLGPLLSCCASECVGAVVRLSLVDV